VTVPAPSTSSRTLFNLLALAVLIALVTIGTRVYVTQENAFYWSDFNFYQLATWFTKEAFLQSPVGLPFLLLGSTKLTHNLLFTLPLLPFYLLGDQRWVYVLALMIAYVVPCSLVLGQIARFTATRDPSMAPTGEQQKTELQILFWTCVAVAFLTPTFSIVALRGYPDFAPALAISAAAYIYLRDPDMSSWRRITSIGVLIGLAALLRRHYVYADMALVLSMVIHQIAIAGAANTPRRWLAPLLRLAMIGVTAALFLCTVGYLMVVEVVSHNYLSL
jgi:hypothetical protein